MSNSAEQPDPEAHFKSFPLELLMEPANLTLAELAVIVAAEDPRILPALGSLANRVGNGKLAKERAALAAFLLGRQYAEKEQLEQLLNASTDEVEHGSGDTEIAPPAA